MNQYKTGTFLKQGLTNGMLDHVPNLARITFKFCKSHGSSRTMREFIESEIVDFAKQCPTSVVYLKPRRHRDPCVVAEYINGHRFIERNHPSIDGAKLAVEGRMSVTYREELRCNPFSKVELVKWIHNLSTSSGTTTSRILRYQATNSISIQGPWNPWVFKPTEDFLEKLPSEKLSKSKGRRTATEQLLEISKISQLQ